MKTLWALVVPFTVSATATAMINVTEIVTPRTCIPTPTPQMMSGAYTSYTSPSGISSVDSCRRSCLNSDSCIGFVYGDDFGDTCMLFDWISTAFDAYYQVNSERCGSQLPQENVQFPGLEIAKVQAADANQCSYKCEATLGCYAYSWSATDGGSCSLKSEKPTAFTGPYDGSVLSGEVYKCGRPHIDYDLKGSDLASVPAYQWTDCCPICRRTSGCEGFSWSDFNDGTCVLKTKVTPKQLQRSTGFTSALMLGNRPVTGPYPCIETDQWQVFGGQNQVYSDTQRTLAECREICLSTNCSAFVLFDGYCTVSDWVSVTAELPDLTVRMSWRCRHQLPQENSNFPGLALRTVITKDADRCSYKCDSTANCWAYSWTKANNGTCILKSNKPATASEPFDGSVVSGESYKCTEPQFDLEVVGVDLASVPRATWSDCCGVCRRTAGCEAFSWSSYSGGTCWLKTKVTRQKMKRAPGIVSAYIFNQKATCSRFFKKFDGVRETWNVKSQADCERMCQFSNCVGYEWTSSPRTECNIYSWIVRVVDLKIDEDTVYVRCRPQLLQENGGYAGSDIGSVPSDNAAFCSYECEGTPGCYAYTWASGTCNKKSMKPSQLSGPSDGSVVSGEVLSVLQLYLDYDVAGHDVGSAQRDTWAECVGVCRRTTGCYEFTWSAYNGGTCWLKGVVPASDRKWAPGVVWVSLKAPPQ